MFGHCPSAIARFEAYAMAKQVQHMKRCTRLSTLLYRVVSCCMKFDCDQTFSLNKCYTIQHFLCFPGCCMMLYSLGHPMQLCCTLLYSRVSSRSNFPATVKLATMYKKYCMMSYETLYSFGWGFTPRRFRIFEKTPIEKP